MINFAFGKGFRKLHEHDLGPSNNPVKISSRGTFFQIGISQHFAIVDLFPRKKRIRIQARPKSRLHKVFYLH